jgi:transposase
MHSTDPLATGVQHFARRERVVVLGVNEEDRRRDAVNGRKKPLSQRRRAIKAIVIRDKCSQALHILDFHIVAKMNEALDDVRAAESRKMAQEGHQPLLKKSRWCVLKRKENLTSQQNLRLRDLLRYNLQSVRAYLLKEDLQQFWEYNSPTWAGMFLDF